jgi:hypothetical protein
MNASIAGTRIGAHHLLHQKPNGILARFGFASSAFTKPTAIQHPGYVVAAMPRCVLLFKKSLRRFFSTWW